MRPVTVILFKSWMKITGILAYFFLTSIPFGCLAFGEKLPYTQYIVCFFDKTILYIVKTVTFSGNAKEGKVHKCKEVFFRNLVFSKINHNIIIMKRGENYE
ncbi:hypothetical protein DV713_20410 (plasmid) [Parageobacillus thermoglucosidasius]|nr:hypothetical protein DV713_20410 [Parageobacillus thermoglucosidasius]